MAPKLTTLDDAWSAWVAGRPTEAIQACVGILEADPAHDTAAALLARVLVDEGVAGADWEALRLAAVFVDRGDLPQAVALAKIAGGAALAAVAEAFGRGSARLADVPPAPPPLPQRDVGPVNDEGPALMKRAKKALDGGSKASGETQIPDLPLFSDLEPEALEQLLAAFELRSVTSETPVLTEGDEGAEAFVVVRGYLRAYRGEGDDKTVLAELGPGAIFGEMALVSGAPRAASVMARDTVQLLVGSIKGLEQASKKWPRIGEQLSQFCRTRMISNLVRHSRILGAVAPSERQALMDRFDPRSFERGEKLVEREKESESLFLIASGQVRVMGRDSDGDELVVAELGPGDVVGEISLVLRRPATADVIATHHTVALELTRDEFQAVIRDYPQLLGELYELATKRDEEMKTVVAQETLDVEDVVLL